MAISSVPPASSLIDAQFIQITGPDGLTTGYQFDEQQKALYFKESQVLFPTFHGATHIAEDPVPNATCDTPGLLAADDKCKLDALLQTRLGVLGFQGAGFPDDGGWMQGDIILAAGTEFISLERIGNVIRFTVDSPIPLNCACFKAGARVLMADGTTKAIENIKKGDLVITHNGNIKPVRITFRTPHDGPISQWKADKHSGESLSITNNHPVMALERGYAYVPSGRARRAVKENPQWVEAGRIRPGDLLSRRRSHNIVEDVETIDILTILGDGFVERDGLVYSCITKGARIGQIDGMAHGIPRYIAVNNDLLDLIGYYAAEGCASKKNGLRFSVHTEEFYFGDIGAEICRILATMFGLEPKINGRATPNGRDIQIFSVPLIELFSRWFVGTKKNKRFPEWIMQLTPAKQARIVAATIKGDGYIIASVGKTATSTNAQITLGLSSRFLSDQCLFMAERCGWEPSNPPPKINGSRIRYCMMISASNAPDLCNILGIKRQNKKLSRERKVGNKVLHRLVERSEHHYKGDVFNFEVEDDNSYIVDGIEVHNCEECQQIFWVQDETDIASIRPPTCGGKLPGVNAYGEIKIYLFPESTIVDPNDAAVTLNNKGQFPAFIFKRFDDTIIPGAAEHEMILKRDDFNDAVTEIGWAMTPGATGIPEMVWFMGKDNDGNQIRFDLEPNSEPGLLGTLLYKGHLLTKKMGVITDFTSTILSTNQYTIKEWDVDANKAVGDIFTARNVWQYANPENPASGANPQALILDSTIDLLPIGTLVNLWAFKVGEVAGEPILRHYFSKKPALNPNHIWTWAGRTQFGDVAIAREEVMPSGGSEDKDVATQVSAIRTFERNLWGLTGFDDPLLSFDIAQTAGTENADLSTQHRAVIDTTLPGLRVVADPDIVDDFSERPVWLWNRRNFCNALVRTDIGRPDSSDFVPFDLMLRSQIDEGENKYMRVIGTGDINGLQYVRVCGVHFHDLPSFGSLRVLSPDGNHNKIFNYTRKFAFPSTIMEGTEPTAGFAPEPACDSIILSGDTANNVAYPGSVGDIVELLHQEYTAPVVRVEFSFNPATGLVELQFKVGILDMSLPYEEDIADDIDDYVRGLAPGYAVSAIYSQAGTFTGVGTQPASSLEGFVVFDGGAQIGGAQDEFWNRLEVMLRDNQIWIWWNQLLIPPSTILSSALPTPITIDTPYFPITVDPDITFGKIGMRMWPGTKFRRIDLRTQVSLFSEFTFGQLEVS